MSRQLRSAAPVFRIETRKNVNMSHARARRLGSMSLSRFSRPLRSAVSERPRPHTHRHFQVIRRDELCTHIQWCGQPEPKAQGLSVAFVISCGRQPTLPGLESAPAPPASGSSYARRPSRGRGRPLTARCPAEQSPFAGSTTTSLSRGDPTVWATGSGKLPDLP